MDERFYATATVALMLAGAFGNGLESTGDPRAELAVSADSIFSCEAASPPGAAAPGLRTADVPFYPPPPGSEDAGVDFRVPCQPPAYLHPVDPPDCRHDCRPS